MEKDTEENTNTNEGESLLKEIEINFKLLKKNAPKEISEKVQRFYDQFITLAKGSEKEHILEKCFYSQMNPIIKLSPTNVNKIKFTFINYDSDYNIEYENNLITNDNEIICGKKNEYEFITMSKQNRELIYLLIQFFIIDEKIKNNKIYSLINSENISNEEKLGITDLVGELNIIKNQNKIALKKMNKLNSMNKKLNDDYKILEENFRITLSKINEKNSNLYIKEEIYKANDRSEKNNSIIKQNRASINRINELKKDYEELNIEYKELLSQQQEFDFDKNILLNKENQSQTQLLTTENNLKTLKEKNNSLKNDKNISTEKLSKAKEEYNNIKSKCDANKTKLNKLNQENENFLMKSAEFIKINKNKNEILKMKENNEILVKENKNLLKERDVLNQEKNQLSSELEKLKQEINELNQINSSNILSTENNDIINELRAINENRKNELKKLKEEYESLVNEQKILQENYPNGKWTAKAAKIMEDYLESKPSDDENIRIQLTNFYLIYANNRQKAIEITTPMRDDIIKYKKGALYAAEALFSEGSDKRRDRQAYEIIKKFPSGEEKSYTIFSNILISKMDEEEYRECVFNELLSDKNIALSNASGYIGQISDADDESIEIGKESIGRENYLYRINKKYALEFDAADLSAVILYERRKMEEKTKDEMQETEERTTEENEL